MVTNPGTPTSGGVPQVPEEATPSFGLDYIVSLNRPTIEAMTAINKRFLAARHVQQRVRQLRPNAIRGGRRARAAPHRMPLAAGRVPRLLAVCPERGPAVPNRAGPHDTHGAGVRHRSRRDHARKGRRGAAPAHRLAQSLCSTPAGSRHSHAAGQPSCAGPGLARARRTNAMTSPTTPRRNSSTVMTKMAPWITSTHSPRPVR